jgi:hypothetical protein
LQSLLNQKQSQWAKEMLGNIRLACCVAGGMNLVPKEDDVLEVREGLGLKYKTLSVCGLYSSLRVRYSLDRARG